MPRLLNEEELREKLAGLEGWTTDGRFITKKFSFQNFMDGIKFVNRVAKIAEEQEHHPDIHVRWTDVTLSIQTHSEGGVTEWDVELAREIEKRAVGLRARRQAKSKARRR